MARMDVWRPRGSRTRGALLAEVQSDLHSVALRTRICVPLIPLDALRGHVNELLNPVFEIGGHRFALKTDEMGAFEADTLSERVGSIAVDAEDRVMKAIDHLLLGT